MVQEQGGQHINGWAIWQWASILVEAEAHSVWRSPEGELVDITPHDNGERAILFLHDADMAYSGQSIGNVRLAITGSPLAAELVNLGNKIDAVMCSYAPGTEIPREIIRTNVDKETGDKIRNIHLEGVKVDEDYKRYYPYDTLASKVLGFTGGDNQGIIGLEVAYESYLKGINGTILTMTDAAGVEIENAFEDRIEPISGNDLHISLDVNIQQYVEQAAYETMEKKGSKHA